MGMRMLLRPYVVVTDMPMALTAPMMAPTT